MTVIISVQLLHLPHVLRLQRFALLARLPTFAQFACFICYVCQACYDTLELLRLLQYICHTCFSCFVSLATLLAGFAMLATLQRLLHSTGGIQIDSPIRKVLHCLVRNPFYFFVLFKLTIQLNFPFCVKKLINQDFDQPIRTPLHCGTTFLGQCLITLRKKGYVPCQHYN